MFGALDFASSTKGYIHAIIITETFPGELLRKQSCREDHVSLKRSSKAHGRQEKKHWITQPQAKEQNEPPEAATGRSRISSKSPARSTAHLAH